MKRENFLPSLVVITSILLSLATYFDCCKLTMFVVCCLISIIVLHKTFWKAYEYDATDYWYAEDVLAVLEPILCWISTSAIGGIIFASTSFMLKFHIIGEVLANSIEIGMCFIIFPFVGIFSGMIIKKIRNH